MAKTKVLFICIENANRSQMAEGFAHAFGGDMIEPYSAGSKPRGEINPKAIEFMRELDIDISTQSSTGFDDLPTHEFDYVVTMGCGDVCPYVPAKQHLDWDLPDPKSLPPDEFRAVRDEIGRRVKVLIEGM
jgi:protein-tyrosine-phosphatase